MTARRRRAALTRRSFMTLLAAGSAAALAAPARALAAASSKSSDKSGGKTPVPSDLGSVPADPHIAKALREQKTSLAGTLKNLRAFELPPGSEQGFAFRPLPARKRRA